MPKKRLTGFPKPSQCPDFPFPFSHPSCHEILELCLQRASRSDLFTPPPVWSDRPSFFVAQPARSLAKFSRTMSPSHPLALFLPFSPPSMRRKCPCSGSGFRATRCLPSAVRSPPLPVFPSFCSRSDSGICLTLL